MKTTTRFPYELPLRFTKMRQDTERRLNNTSNAYNSCTAQKYNTPVNPIIYLPSARLRTVLVPELNAEVIQTATYRTVLQNNVSAGNLVAIDITSCGLPYDTNEMGVTSAVPTPDVLYRGCCR